MKLADFLKQHDITATAFAGKLGVSPSTVTRWLAGAIPDKDAMPRIFEATEGQVRPDDFFGLGDDAA